MDRARILVQQVALSAGVAGGTERPAPATWKAGAGALPKLGDENDFTNDVGEPDLSSGLKKLSARIPASIGLGYYTSFRQSSDGRVLESQVLLCNQPEFIGEIMESEVQHYLWGGIRPASEAFFGAKVLFVLEGKEWQSIRQSMRPVLTPNNLPEVTGDLALVAKELVEKLTTCEGEEVDLSLAIRCFHISSVTRALYTTEIPALRNFPERHQVHEAFDFLLDELARRAFHKDLDVQWDYESDNEDNRAWKAAKEKVHKAVYDELQGRLGGATQNAALGQCPMRKNPDMLAQLLTEYEKTHPASTAQKKMEDLGANLVELIFAGYNTVVNTMAIAIMLLVQHPDFLRRAREEMDATLKDEVTFDDLEKLEFLDAVFCETLRLYPPAPGIARRLESDHTLGSVIVPKGSEIMFPMVAVHRDTRYWDRPDEFNPDRWKKKHVPFSFMPFSAGARRCLGQHYARLLFLICVSTIVKKFDVVLADDYKFRVFFNGFGSMTWDDTTNSNCMRVKLRPRVQ
eukprot:GEMP01017011.1.p1 GENE.GEMP01017011.1~~GEMP01017011.1.p1  ORF type:complete len:527 (+),score=128.45 GEMP01017011.1:37-1581(+)